MEIKTIAGCYGGPGCNHYFLLLGGKILCQYAVNDKSSFVYVQASSPMGIAGC